MHEHGLVDRLVARALAASNHGGGRLRTVHVRLGAMATISVERLRSEFDHIVREHLKLDVQLQVEQAPDRPVGLELVAVELVEA